VQARSESERFLFVRELCSSMRTGAGIFSAPPCTNCVRHRHREPPAAGPRCDRKLSSARCIARPWSEPAQFVLRSHPPHTPLCGRGRVPSICTSSRLAPCTGLITTFLSEELAAVEGEMRMGRLDPAKRHSLYIHALPRGRVFRSDTLPRPRALTARPRKRNTFLDDRHRAPVLMFHTRDRMGIAVHRADWRARLH